MRDGMRNTMPLMKSRLDDVDDTAALQRADSKLQVKCAERGIRLKDERSCMTTILEQEQNYEIR